MSQSLYSIWEQVDKESFFLEEEGKRLFKDDIEYFIEKLRVNLLSIADWLDKKIFLDIKDKKLFIITFFTLLKLKSKIVLVPSEIKIEDYVYNGGIFLSDNKHYKEGVFLQKDLFVKPGESFNADDQKLTIKDDNTVIYLYTSGSTGKAKLIPKSSLNLLAELEELKNILSINKEDIFYFTPPLYHIYGLLFGFLLPVFSSSKIIVDYNFTPESIADFVLRKKITHFISIPSYYKMFVELELIDHFRSCKKLLSSSAPLPIDISKKFYQERLQIIEVYGSTETGGIAYRTSALSLEWKLFSYVEIFTEWIDYINGEKEIIDQIELRIISPTISVDYDKRIGFNTGDIVKIFKNDGFMLLGRNTRFVKISGKRVDLHYVLEKVREYLTYICEQEIKAEELYIGEKDERIYVLFEKKFPKNSKEMKNDLKKHLPGYAVPRLFVNGPIPKNPMGKINKTKIQEIIMNLAK
ncbi:MAG: acyl--CoA ligase [Spirochaetes bacterium]|nr:acyl--CoA ligase [Spirochaetota bacterium]